MVLIALLTGCDGCDRSTLSLGDASFDVFGDGGLDGLYPDGGISDGAASGAPPGGGTAANGSVPVPGTGTAGTPSGVAGVGTPAGSGAIAGASGGWGIAGIGGTAGIPWGGSGGSSSSGPRCDAYSTCWYTNGTICDQFGFCCTPTDGDRCCNGESCKPTPTWNSPPVPASVDKPWAPPLPAASVGTPGWRQSTEPFCTNRTGTTYAHSVWSDSRGVYVATTTEGYGGSETEMCPYCIREAIHFNDGTGWTLVPGAAPENDTLQANGQMTLTGFDNGPLVLYGYGAYDVQTMQPCSLMTIENGERRCEPVDGVSDVHVVSSTLAYGVLNGSLIRYDGERWGPAPASLPSQGTLGLVWANDTVVMASGQMSGTIYTLRDGTWSVENTRTLENFTTIWGFAANDVWAGTIQGGLYHYDGTAWSKVEWPGSGCNYESVILGMWGSGGVLYFATTTSIGRWNGTQAEVIASWPCDANGQNVRITSVWGNSPTEVFFSIVDDRRPVIACGSAFVLNYDGSQFHQM